MSGTFSSFGTALSALRYNRVAMDVASGNIANVGTEGYTRRKVDSSAVGGPDVPAIWSRYDGAGDGVRVDGVNRMTDELLDVRSRREHGNQAYLDVRQTALERVETGVGEPGGSGVSAALAKMRAAWHELANAPGSSAARAQVLAGASTVVDAFKAQARNVQGEAADQRLGLQGDVAEVGTLATELANLNGAVAAGRANGDDVNTLLDRRDQITLRLSELTGATATTRADGTADVSLGGVALVSGTKAGTFVLSSGVTAAGDADGSPIGFTVTAADGTSATLAGGIGGQVGGRRELLDVTLPAYLTRVAGVAKDFADQTNAQHALGYDAAGAAGGALLSYDPADVLGTLGVAITDPAKLAASSVAGGGLDAGNASRLATGPGVEGSYQRVVTDLGSSVLEAQRRAANQQVLTTQVDGAREQLTGVNLDEEMVNMLAAQHAYEAASRVMTTLDSVLDTLINRTGLTH